MSHLRQLTNNAKTLNTVGAVFASVFWPEFSEAIKATLNGKHVNSPTEIQKYLLLFKITTCLQSLIDKGKNEYKLVGACVLPY